MSGMIDLLFYMFLVAPVTKNLYTKNCAAKAQNEKQVLNAKTPGFREPIAVIIIALINFDMEQLNETKIVQYIFLDENKTRL